MSAVTTWIGRAGRLNARRRNWASTSCLEAAVTEAWCGSISKPGGAFIVTTKVFDEPDFGIDEQWARIYPYGQEVQPERWTPLAVKLLNHSRSSNTFVVTMNAPPGFEIEPRQASVTVPSGQEAEAQFRLRAPSRPARAIQVVTADIQVGPWDLRQWCEAIVKVQP